MAKCDICKEEIDPKDFTERRVCFHSRKIPSGRRRLYSHRSCYNKELKIIFRKDRWKK